MTHPILLRHMALLATGAIGGWIASFFPVPMPWMLGSLTGAALLVGLAPQPFDQDYRFPKPFRNCFVALIGVMIGTQVTPALFGQLVSLPLVFVALVGFVLLAHLGNFAIFTRLGGFDRATAFYSGTPGGLMEAIAMAEASGADQRIVSLQQFLRIIVVVTTVPAGLSLWAGEPLGSSAGLAAPDLPPVPPLALALIGLAALAGLQIGKRIKLPAAHITGPMILAAAATLTGSVDLHLPPWLIAMAQVVIGASLGAQFVGITFKLLKRALLLCLCSVSFMLCLGGLVAAGLAATTGLPFVHMLISFAPGGVTEMSLVALSLAMNPALVSLNHILRILLTVLMMGGLARFLGIGPSPS